ncbi:MAG: zinc ribbon domain-containing protein [Planctomycetes bacterium]|nr:zinc ribbon domain-containing protein [Planctomycetota bacterium]
MPTYDYQCDACGHKFEQFQSITISPLKKCPKCGKLKLKRLLGTGVGVIFKGSGFYETDYRSEGYKKAAQNDKPASPASTESKTEKTETKKESKPATESKTESKPSPKKKTS